MYEGFSLLELGNLLRSGIGITSPLPRRTSSYCDEPTFQWNYVLHGMRLDAEEGLVKT